MPQFYSYSCQLPPPPPLWGGASTELNDGNYPSPKGSGFYALTYKKSPQKSFWGLSYHVTYRLFTQIIRIYSYYAKASFKAAVKAGTILFKSPTIP